MSLIGSIAGLIEHGPTSKAQTSDARYIDSNVRVGSTL